MEQLDRAQALEVLRSAPVAHLGLIEGDRPYVTPMSFVMLDDQIVFRTMAGRKLDALRANPNVCVEASQFDAETGHWKSVIVRGTAVEIDDDDVKARTVSQLFRKYDEIMGSPLSPSAGLQPLKGLPHVIIVDMDEITGMSSGQGWSVRTRPGRL